MVQGAWNHQTVLLNEAVQALGINPDGHYVDATFGRGGHSRLILEQLSRKGILRRSRRQRNWRPAMAVFPSGTRGSATWANWAMQAPTAC